MHATNLYFIVWVLKILQYKLALRRPWDIFSEKLIFKKSFIDENKDILFGSQMYKLVIHSL